MNGLLLESLGWALLHSLWQGALVAVLLAAALATVGRSAAAARYGLACGALLLMLALPAATAWRHHSQSSARSSAVSAPVAPAPAPMFSARPTVELGAPRVERALPASAPREAVSAPTLEWVRAGVAANLPWLVLAWAVGVAVCSARLATGWLRLRRLAREAVPAPTEWQARLDTLAQRLGLKRAVKLLQASSLDVPAAVGWVSPVVLLPVSALSGLSVRQLEMVLAHELAHIRRHDFAVNLAQVLVETLLFFHPAVWWMSHVVRVEREHCCDDIAVGASGSTLSYAKALTALESLRVLPVGPSPALSALGGSLPERVRRLITAPGARCSSRWVAGASVLTLASSLAVAAPLTSLVLGRDAEHAASTGPVPALPSSRVASAGNPVPPPAPLPSRASLPGSPVSPPALPTVSGVAPAALSALPNAPAVIAPIPGGVAAPRPPAPPAPPPPPSPVRNRGDRDDNDDLDDRTRVGSSALTVDQLVELKVAGVTPERVKEIEGLGYEPTVSTLVEMGHAGLTSEYVKDMNARFGRKLDADTLVGMKHMGVTPEFIASMKSQGFAVSDPDELVQARAVGVDEAYLRELKSAGLTGQSLEDVAEMRAVGVTPEFIASMNKQGLTKLDADTLTELRAVGVTPQWLDTMRQAGVSSKDADELVQLRALDVDPDFLREMRDAGLKDLSVDELIRLRSGGVDADFIRKLRGKQ